jgi:hypothetical protein
MNIDAKFGNEQKVKSPENSGLFFIHNNGNLT